MHSSLLFKLKLLHLKHLRNLVSCPIKHLNHKNKISILPQKLHLYKRLINRTCSQISLHKRLIRIKLCHQLLETKIIQKQIHSLKFSKVLHRQLKWLHLSNRKCQVGMILVCKVNQIHLLHKHHKILLHLYLVVLQIPSQLIYLRLTKNKQTHFRIYRQTRLQI